MYFKLLNHRIGGKDPTKREDAIVRCCHKKKERSLSVLFLIPRRFSDALFAASPLQ
ncbi:MAG: hypothetical protein ACLRX4_13035 [Oscillospiraceae bacterium]